MELLCETGKRLVSLASPSRKERGSGQTAIYSRVVALLWLELCQVDPTSSF